MTNRTLTVAELLHNAELIDGVLNAIKETAPKAVAALGGIGTLANLAEMTCIGPIPRLDQQTWEAMSHEQQAKYAGNVGEEAT